MRVVFLASGAFAIPSLEALVAAGHEVAALVTQPDRASGRGLALVPPNVKPVAERHGIPVLQLPRVRTPEAQAELRRLAPELQVVVAFGQILPRAVIDIAPRGTINVHASLLPRFRGAAPIQWALASGDARTGVCLMKMDAGMDTGPLLARAELDILPADTSQTLHDKLSALGGGLLREHLAAYLEGRLAPVPQARDGVVMAPMIIKEDGRIDFSRPAVELERRLRAFTPWPGLYTTYAGGLLKVIEAQVTQGRGVPGTVLDVGPAGLEVACGQGALRWVKLQPEGKRAMEAREFLASRKIEKGQRPFE